MGEETLKTVLKEFGLTDTEVQVYLCVSKQAPITGTDAAHLIKKDKAQVFRTLKNLQGKGFIESTLEIPMRFTPVAFEKVLELTVKEKKQQAERIEETKEQLLNYWKSLNKKDLDTSIEKLVVIEGRHKVYSKIAQMITEAKIQISAASTVSGLLRAERFGIFTNIKPKQSVKLRLLAETPNQNLTRIKHLLKSIIKNEMNFVAKNPDLGFSVFPRIVIKDNREAVFFITPRNTHLMEEDGLCLWTNCKDLVESFSRVYEDLWQNASVIQDRIQELKTIKQTLKCNPTDQINKIQIQYKNALQSAKTEILAITSSEGLDEFAEFLLPQKERFKNIISIKIMAPITNQNLQIAQQLSKYWQIKHITASYQKTTLIDQKHLFQFTIPQPNPEWEDTLSESSKKTVSYTNDPEQVQKIRNVLDKIWQNSQTPSFITLESILNVSANASEELLSQDGLNVVKKINALKISDEQPEIEKDIINRIINAKRIPVKDPSKDLTRVYGFNGQAVIHPPQTFHLPDIMIHAFHNDKQSAYGIEDYMVIYLWLQTPKGPTFVPVTIVGDVKKGEKGLKAVWQGTPAAQNIKVVKKTQLHIQMHANMFFAGWTIPIPLMNPQNILPPAAITLEAVGKLNTKTFTVNMPNGYKVKLERNGYSAYVTFLHPKSKYNGPGSDGFINRELIMTTTPPSV